jgi:hypothetical protein
MFLFMSIRPALVAVLSMLAGACGETAPLYTLPDGSRIDAATTVDASLAIDAEPRIHCDSVPFGGGTEFMQCTKFLSDTTWTCVCSASGQPWWSCQSTDGCSIPNCCGFMP